MKTLEDIARITGNPEFALQKPVDVNINNVSNVCEVDKVDKVALGATPSGEPQALGSGMPSSSLCPASPTPSAPFNPCQDSGFSDKGVSGARPEDFGQLQMLPLHNQLSRAVVTLWHRPSKRTKYTLTVTFTMNTGEQVQFNASMTSDIGNFQKYLPDESVDYIWWQLVQPFHKECLARKQAHYMGKFWENDRTAGGKPIEAYTGVIMHYDAENRAWRVHVRFHDWDQIFLLSTNRINESQKAAGVHAMAIWNKPITRQSWSARQQASKQNVASIKQGKSI